MSNLFYGDNLDVLRENINDESVDLIYLDPPFNSKRNYNLLFQNLKGRKSGAQITAFEDTWSWGEQAEREFAELLHQPNTDVSEMIQALRRFLKESDVMAYLVMMANRLLELHRVLKETGSLYLHCDPTASHYLKIVLDAVFGSKNFKNEIAWCYGSGGASKRHYSKKHDIIFFYAKSDNYIFNVDAVREPYSSPEKVKYKVINGKKYLRKHPLGRVPFDWWQMPILTNTSHERLGYPTQKPLALLERIVKASSNSGDIVLDPFCGCGTAVHAAEKLERNWIGIDITHLAITLIEKRMKDAFPSINYEVHGTPKSIEGAKDLADRDKYQFQWWACSLIDAQPYKGKTKGADGGTDGLIFFQDDDTGAKKIIVSVKGGKHVTRTMIADLKNTVEREKAQIGIFVTLAEPTKPMVKEAVSAGYYKSIYGSFPKIQILTIEELLSETKKPIFPDLSRGSLSFKKAKVEEKSATQEKMDI